MNYSKFTYLFPPRPQNAVSANSLDIYETDSYTAQCKMNGTNTVLFLDGINQPMIYNRHAQKQVNVKFEGGVEWKKLHRGKPGSWTIYNGEYLNKNKKGIDGKEFNHKFIIFDILVYENEHLTGTTVMERQELLENLFPEISLDKNSVNDKQYSPYLHLTEHKDTFRVKNFAGDFSQLYDEITKHEVFEGLVLKKKLGKLSPCFNEGNNSSYQVKVRKSTKLYQF